MLTKEIPVGLKLTEEFLGGNETELHNNTSATNTCVSWKTVREMIITDPPR